MKRPSLLLIASLAGKVYAQEQINDKSPADEVRLQTVTVLGSHIAGSRVAPTVPLTIVTPDQISALGVVTGDDLMRSIPQMGDVTFNVNNGQQTSNSARGDIASVDLRGAGIGDTLLLINGRRVVEHPTSQSKGGVPLISYNAQAVPTSGIGRLEVLAQGAAAIYGADAVAGVVNVVTRDEFHGLAIDAKHGDALGTHRQESTLDIQAGDDLADHRANLTLNLTLYHRSAQEPSDKPYTATQDLRPLFADDPAYSTSSVPDSRGTQSSYPALTARSVSGETITKAISQSGVALTTGAGVFHIQPSSLNGCVSQLAAGLCIARGSVPYSTTANALRYDAYAQDSVTTAPRIDRGTLTLNAHWDLSDAMRLYSEVDYYQSESHGVTTQPTALVPMGVPASNYYNPFGPVTFSDGSANPNRLPNLTNVPASGIPVSFATYRFNDLGPNEVAVDSYQTRMLLGIKGTVAGFDYDSAIWYGQARVRDVSDGIDSTALAAQLAVSTPQAYNPFNGGCLDGSGGQDCTPSSSAALAAIATRLRRVSTTTLSSADYRLSRNDLWRLPAGEIGIAMGIEGRRESHTDERDPRTSGAIPFVDPVLQTTSASDATGVNVTPSTSGSRTVLSAYTELAIPLIGPDMHVPLMHSVTGQLAGRIERYSDFGSVTKPKAALNWNVIPGIQLRASWELGFKAPNLETTAPFTYGRAQTITDWYRCQAALNKGQIGNFGGCNDSYGVSYFESGNPQLRPENSESYDIGAVFEPSLFAPGLGKLTLSIDRWHLHQVGIVGVLGQDNIAVQDYLDRVRGGGGSVNLRRAVPTADDIAFYAGSGLAPVGAPISVSDQFTNLEPLTISGVDIGVNWDGPTSRWGAFRGSLFATHEDQFYQAPGPAVQALFAAVAAGTINAETPLSNAGDELEANGHPKWKATATLNWRRAGAELGASATYTGATRDNNFLSSSGIPWPVASLTLVNCYAQYAFDDLQAAFKLRVRLGVRNLFDRNPPVESDGFNGALYQPYGRYIYASVGVSL